MVVGRRVGVCVGRWERGVPVSGKTDVPVGSGVRVSVWV